MTPERLKAVTESAFFVTPAAAPTCLIFGIVIGFFLSLADHHP